MALYNYIAIEGVIGAGKTTLAEGLSKCLDGNLLKERFEENPFLPEFYKDPEKHAFTTQIFFLLSRYRQLTALHSLDLFHEVVVTDYIFEKDRIFAYINLSEAELTLYKEIEKHLSSDLPKPNLVIYLQTDPSTLIKRIRKRGRSYEKRITEAYITGLVEGYEHFFFSYGDSPLMVINTDKLDLTTETALREVVDRIQRPVQGTEYFNPDRTLWG